jgi:pimeloyl-ACP methyl ester carboxylesterase
MAVSTTSKRSQRYPLAGGMALAADLWGDPSAPPVILLHGGGQTRHAWGAAGQSLADAGFHAIAVDLRGHGESSWDPLGDYRLECHARDLDTIVQTLRERPALVGASLGGMVSLVYEGELYPGHARAVVFVDITPRPEPEGVERVISFMKAHPDGFASIEQAADAVAAYLPHRPVPPDTRGLQRNLRLGADGRWRWHWDPALLEGIEKRRSSADHPERLVDAARAIDVPTLLVRGRMSDVVSERSARDFLDLVPHAEYVDVADAAHMVAGDSNDAFSAAIVEFLLRTLALPSPGGARKDA